MPPATDRGFWQEVDPATRDVLIADAEHRAAAPWPVLTANLWREFADNGNRINYETPNFARRSRLAAAVLAACLTDDPGWHAEVLDGVWLLLEETTWCIPAHDESHGKRGHPDLPDPDNPTLDLFAAETGALLAWTYAVLGDRLADRAPQAVTRLRKEVRRRILVPQRTVDSWQWFGRRGHVNNWNPWINSNVLTCSLLLDTDHAEMVTTAERAIEGLDVFLDGYPSDGACSEGQGYWWRAGASLSECLELLYDASSGALDGFDIPRVRAAARYPVGVHIDGPWYVNVSDGPAQLEGRSAPASARVLHRFGRRVEDPEVLAHARWMRGDGPAVGPGTPLGRSLLALADREWRDAPAVPAPYLGHTWWPETQLLVARQHPGRPDGLLVSVKGGHNAEDHNHNDVGTVLVAVDGHPALVDAGVAEYTRKTFSPQRYEIWTMRSLFHNLPSVDGGEQAPGRAYAASGVSAVVGNEAIGIGLDLAGAYPAEAGISHWRRSVRLDRSGEGAVTLEESWELDHDPEDVRLHLMASGSPETSEPGTITVPTPGRSLAIAYDPAALAADVEPIPLEPGRLQTIWGERLWRIALVVREPARAGQYALRMTAAP